jgi:hypothetical protein
VLPDRGWNVIMVTKQKVAHWAEFWGISPEAARQRIVNCRVFYALCNLGHVLEAAAWHGCQDVPAHAREILEQEIAKAEEEVARV